MLTRSLRPARLDRARARPGRAAARPARLQGSGKPRGIRAGRKLLTDRREQRWASKRYKKANLGTQFKCNPFGGSSHCKGIVLEKIGIEAKQPNSAIRKCVRAQLIKNGKKIAAFVPNDGCLNFVDENVRAPTCRPAAAYPPPFFHTRAGPQGSRATPLRPERALRCALHAYPAPRTRC